METTHKKKKWWTGNGGVCIWPYLPSNEKLFFGRLLTFHLINLESFWKTSGRKTIQLSCWTVREHCSFSFKSNQVSSQSWLRSLFLLTCKVAAYHPKATASTSSSQARAKVCRWEMQQIHYWQGCSHHCGRALEPNTVPGPPPPSHRVHPVAIIPLKCKPQIQLCLLWLSSPKRTHNAVNATTERAIFQQRVWSAAVTSLGG